jgi:integrase
VNDYVDNRIAQGGAVATINRELSALRRALNLGVEDGLLADPGPPIKLRKEKNVRKGFIEHDVYLKILNALPSHQQMLFCFAYYLGIRHGELLELRWEWLLPYWRETEPIIKIPGEVTKSGEPHTIPIYHPDMRGFFEMAIADRNPKCPYVSQYQGRLLKSTRTGREKALVIAEQPKVLFHDTRRTAVRLMERAGIPRAEAIQITGHKTESVYKRYDISSGRGATETGKRLREHWRDQHAPEAENGHLATKTATLGDKLGDARGVITEPTHAGQAAKRIN